MRLFTLRNRFLQHHAFRQISLRFPFSMLQTVVLAVVLAVV